MKQNYKDIHMMDLRALPGLVVGLDRDAGHEVVENLTNDPACKALLTQKPCIAQWNVVGAGFFVLYTLLGFQFDQRKDISEDGSRLTRRLSGSPMGGFGEFLNRNHAEVLPGVVSDTVDLEAAILNLPRFCGRG